MKEDPDWRRKPDSLGGLRKEIDRVDEEIISLLIRRQAAARAIGRIKMEQGMEVFDPAREREVLRKLISLSNGNLSAEHTENIFREIISASRSVQQLLNVAFLGPAGAFTHEAALTLFGRSACFQPMESIEGVFSMVEKDLCRQGIVPIENSCEGSVHTTMDLFFRYDLKVCGEVFLRIRHHLLSSGQNREEIKIVYSHPMAIAQCRSWIMANLPGVSIKELESTSAAAQRASMEKGAAAIGSRLAAHVYNLNRVAENIEDNPDNVTRFLCIGKTDAPPTGKDKTSMLFFLNHKPGALHRALGALAENGINVSRIESRPAKMKKWEYLFFIDMEGHYLDEPLSKAIPDFEKQCVFVKRLGSYPAGDGPWK